MSLLWVSLLLTAPASAQTYGALTEAARAAEAAGDRPGAAYYYAEALLRRPDDHELRLRLARLYIDLYEYRAADRELRKIPDGYRSARDYYLGYVLQALGKYKPASYAYRRYLTARPSGEYYRAATLGLESVQWAYQQRARRLNATAGRLPDLYNSELSEVAPYFEGDDLNYYVLRDEGTQHNEVVDYIRREAQPPSTDRGVDALRLSGVALLPGGARILSRCRPESSSDRPYRCQLYLQQSINSAPKPLKASFNRKRTHTTHPTIAGHKLIFATDEGNERGSMHLWEVDLLPNGAVGKARKLPISTEGNDITPYYDAATGWLYFASDGRVGYGGYDIYATPYPDMDTVYHLGAEINSSYHDIWPTRHPIVDSLIYTSNRPFESLSYCCFDLYQAPVSLPELPPRPIASEAPIAATPSSDPPMPLGSTTPTLDEQTPSARPSGTPRPSTTTAERTTSVARVDTPGGSRPASGQRTPIDHNPEATGATTTEATGTTTTTTPPSERPAVRPGDRSITTEVMVEDLPTAMVYFDNDYPDPDTRRTTSTVDYPTSAADYLRAQPEYVRQTPAVEREAIATFFEQRVRGGLRDLVAARAWLESRLQAGQGIRLRLSGFASPKSKSDYNLALSRRRIDSVRRYLLQSPTVAAAYRSGQLTFEVNPFGEVEASRSVSDSQQDISNSIYSVGAASERRVALEVLAVSQVLTR